MEMKTVEQQTQEFYDKFYPEIQEIIILTPDDVGDASSSEGDVLWTASQYLIGYIDLKTNQLVEVRGCVEWLAEDEFPNYGYDFKPITQYRLKVRRAKPANPKYYSFHVENNIPLPDLSHDFMLIEIVETDLHEPRLDKIREDFLQPVFIENDLGKFELNKDLNIYYGDIDWLGETISVSIEDNEDSNIVNRSFEHLNYMVKNTQDFDNKMRQFSAEKLLENAQDWQADSDEADSLPPLTIEIFMQRISLSELVINDDEGNFTAYYDDGDLFWGHVIIVDGNIDGSFDDAYIAG